MANPEEISKTKDKETDPQPSTVKKGGSNISGVGTGEDTSLRGGRNRFCKQCKFTCKDSREFSQHQLSAHSETEENRCLQNSLAKESSSRRGSTKSQSPQSAGSNKTDHLAGSNSNNTSKMNREVDEITGDHIYKDIEEDELDDRLVIAEENDESFSHTPIRSGNIQNRTYICPSCDFSSTSAKVFLHHQKDIHGKDFTIYECDVCDYATRYKQKLPRHRKLHFPGLEFNNSSGAAGSMSMSDNTADNSDIAMIGEDDIRRKLDDDLEDELDEEEMDLTADDGLVIDDTMKTLQKTKRTRQEVDPAKYIEVMDDSGIKYSCSKCGNIYKWRKSLNKHWKEKHADEKLDGLKPVPPTLNPIKHVSSKSAHEYMRQEACDKFAFKKECKPNGYKEEENACGDASSSVNDCVMPKMIGPFITNSYVPIYSTENSQSSSGQPGVDHEALDLSSKPTTSSSRNTQREPLDFSFKKEPYTPGPSEMVAVKSEPIWDDENEMSKNPEDSQVSPVLQCVKCAFVAKTLIDYSSHMAVHLNKRAFKCAECQQHFNCVEELNNHFGKTHVEKIQEHRDVIQKIPHGLQQTYHLLQMPLASSEFSPTENRQLKCSRCDFVAKWPAELQKHAVSHSEERPFICMVCGSTYKWKWDLVKHFEKSHSTLTNPYKRRPTVSGPNGSCIEPDSAIATVSRTADALVDRDLDSFILPPMKKRRLSETDLTTGHHPFYQDDDKQAETGARGENQNSSEDFLQNNRSPPVRTRERPSSVPPNFNHITDKNSQYDEDNDIPGLQITNVFSLVKDKSMMGSSESQEAGTSQISASAEQHRAVNAALRQRINMSNNRSRRQSSTPSDKDKSCADILLPYKCTLCQYRARWPSEITQHMKNHSDEKPFCCPECSYKSKWKWDVVKHMKRCGGGTVKDVIDNSKQRSCGPPNVVLAVREEPNNSQNIPKLSNNHVANGETPISYKNSACRASTPSAASVAATAAATAATAAAAAAAADGRSHSQSLLDLRRDSSSSRPNPVFRGLVNDGLYHCLECQFIGHSPAELKRHAYLHSEDKPYVCDVCSYSSRWKCDLKKHIRTYNHHIPQGSVSHSEGSDRPDSGSASSFQTQREEKPNKDDDDYEDDFPDDTDGRSDPSFYSADYQKPMKEPGKQSCTKCDFVTNDLAAFLQHRLTHDSTHSSNNSSNNNNNSSNNNSSNNNNSNNNNNNNNSGGSGGSSSSSTSSGISQQTSVPINTVSSRTRHLKNRRKPMKQFRCPKCPFVCLTEQDLTIHEGRHKPLGSNAVKCFYCDFSVLNSNKVALIQHLYLHPEFDPSDKGKLKEILNYSNLSDVWQANEEMDDDDSYEYYEPPQQMEVYRERPSVAEQKKEEAEARASTFEPHSMNGIMLKKEPMCSRLQCEWCEAGFAHISTLYQHARSVHPILLQQQEYENNIKYDNFLPPTYNGMAVSQNSTFNVILPKIAQTPKKIQPSTVIKPKKNPSPGKIGGPFKCQKCPFIGASSNTYSRHMERHGSNCKHTCLYCDYSIDRLNLLHQHMRGSHGHDVKQSPLNTSSSEKSVHNGPPKAETPNRVILATPTYIQKNESSNETHLRLIAPKPVEIKSNEISPSLPILENGPNGKYLYRCPTCSFNSPKVNATMLHIRTHSTSNAFNVKPLAVSKQPEYRNFIHTQQHNGKKIGSNCSQDNSFQNDFDRNEMLLGQPKIQSQQSSQVTTHKNIFACQQCPFKTISKDSLQDHQEFHGYKGQYQCDFCNFSVDHINIFCDHTALHNNLINNNNDNDNNNNSINNNMSVPNSNNNASNTNSGHHTFHQHHNHQSKQNPSQVDTRLVTASQPKVNLHRPFGGVQFRSKYDGDRRNKLNIQQMLKQVKNTGRVRYKCMQCPYRTCCKNNIIKHRKQHIIKSRYKCPYCNYSAARKYLLQQHLKFHRDETGEQEKDFQDVVLDPFDENSVKNLKESSDLLNAEKKTLPTPVSSSSSSLASGRFTVLNNKAESVKNVSKIISVPNQALGNVQQLEMRSEGGEGEPSSSTADQKGEHFKCDACPFSCSTAYEYRKHCQCHNAQMKYSCDFCSYSIDRFKLLAQHRHLHIPQSTYVPSEDLPSNMDITNEIPNAPDSICSPHTKDAIKDKLFKGPVVTTEVDSDQLYENDTHLDGSDESMRYKCQLCPYMSNSLKSFNVHSRMHGLKRKYKCDYCNWSADRLNLLNQHRKVHAREPNFDPNPDELTFLNREAALQHKETVPPLKHFSKSTTRLLGKKQYSCKTCLFSCNNKSSFISHMSLHNSHTRYLCKYCGYSTDRRNLYQQHEKSHFSQSEEPLPADGKMNTKSRIRCPKCPYHCSAEHLLSSHMKMHETDQRYMCDCCEFSTCNYYAFHKHLETHNPHPNAASQQAETDKHNNENAMRDDEEEEEKYDENESDDEYSCDLCSFSTTSIDEMRYHESQHEGLDDEISCPYCPFTCTKEIDIKKHVVVHQYDKAEGATDCQETEKVAPEDLSLNQNDPSPSQSPNNDNAPADAGIKVTPSPAKSDGTSRTATNPANVEVDSPQDDDQKSQTTVNHVLSTPAMANSSPDSYTCQYCERDFKDINQMQMHEKQHLMGYENLEAVQ